MEKQLEGLAELLNGGLETENTDKQMKELYDCLEQEDRAKEAEYARLKNEIQEISLILDSCGAKQEKSVSARLRNFMSEIYS